MSDSILKQEEIAAYIDNLMARVTALETGDRQKVKEKENATFDAPRDGSALFNQYIFYPCKVTSIVNDSKVRAVITAPTSTSEFVQDTRYVCKRSAGTELAGIDITIPTNVSLPAIDDDVVAHFTGTYTAPDSTVVPVYALFGSGGGTIQEALVKDTTNDDYLVCSLWENGAVTSANTIAVLRPWTMRRSVWDGETIDGLTYTYNAPDDRQVTDGTNVENQVITPDFIVDQSVIVLGSLRTPTYIGSVAIAYVDLNYDGRAWAQVDESS